MVIDCHDSGTNSLVTTMHSALLLTSSGQIEVTKWAIGSNYTNPATLKYKEIEENYQTNILLY